MPKLSEEQRQQRRAHILKAARRCFQKKGFHGSSITDICAAAKVSAGAVYTYFSSKHAMVKALGAASLQASESREGRLGPGDGARLLTERIEKLCTTRSGKDDAQLDLNLWAGSIADAELRRLCLSSFRQAEAQMRQLLGPLAPTSPPEARERTAALGTILTAAMLGMEVQRALGVRHDVDAISRLVPELLSVANKEQPDAH